MREAIELVRRIHGGGITIVIVEHIMEVIVSLARRVVVFHQGREIARGTPREVTSNPAVIEAYLGRRKVRHAATGRTCMSAPLLRDRASRGALRRPDRRRRRLAGGAGGLGGGAARLQRRGQDDDAQRHRRHRPASKGTIEFGGENIAGQPAYAIVRKGLALSPEGWRLFTQQSVENNLLLGATPLADRKRIPRLLERVYAVFPRLAERRRQRAGTMSGGERQMLAVGRALMSEPKLLLLDEPSLGLAPTIVDAMYDSFAALHKDGQTILLAEQSVDLALEAADYAYVLQVGRTRAAGPGRRDGGQSRRPEGLSRDRVAAGSARLRPAHGDGLPDRRVPARS